MKRTAATLALLAGFGGGCASTDSMAKKEPLGGYGTVTKGQQIPGVVGPSGEPVMARATAPSGVMQAGGTTSSGGIQQVSLFGSAGSTSGDCPTCAHVPGTTGMPLWNSDFHAKLWAAANGNVSGQAGPPAGAMPPPNRGILPVPGQGPPGAVAAVGALPLNGGGGPAGVMVGRSSIRFTGPAGMKITWQLPGGGFTEEAVGLTAPKEYNFMQAQVYRLRLTQILPNFPGRSFYPTLEVAPGNPKTLTFLAHSSVPLTFSNEDFEQARAGNLVVKVIYLPDRENQDFATVAGAEELVSTRLEPGADPVAEAQRRGNILAVIRMGNIDLENKASPAMTALPGAGGPRPVPIILPGPVQTMPGQMMPGQPLPGAPKPLTPGPSTPVKPPVPPSGATGKSDTTVPFPAVPTVPPVSKPTPPPPSAPAPDSTSGVPSSLPPISSGSGSGLTLPPASLPPSK